MKLVHHQPLSSAPPPGLPPLHHHLPVTPAWDPNAMEIDATTMRLGNRPPFIINISRSLCRAWNLCFCCLKPVFPVTHTSCLNCLNPPITLAQCEAFFKHCQQSTATTSVAAIHKNQAHWRRRS
ncbi:hypothetical protein PCASD_09678 [Puccinia coronata f. sp. avenae]|uniref:Uncharacterized protein n=1 Tax=Puccinia coronata f. sp. avenae TaxID=200324 RepID=A0A2N5UHX2_9BASI|nr:hypothetical protein PCASD_09678 [Puccinia coronata f. sp. avenae]